MSDPSFARLAIGGSAEAHLDEVRFVLFGASGTAAFEDALRA